MTASFTSHTVLWSNAIFCKRHKAELNGNLFKFLFCRHMDFMDCDDPVDLKGNKTAKEELGYGCLKVIDFTLFIDLT